MTAQVIRARFEMRRDTADSWSIKNPVLREGEFGYDRTYKGYKIGDGVTAWNDLPYDGGEGETTAGAQAKADAAQANAETYADNAVSTHVAAPTPHPAYDDIPSLKLLFENGLVG